MTRRMTHTLTVVAALCSSLAAFAPPPACADSRVAYLKPQYVPPAELAGMLGVQSSGGRGLLEWRGSDGMHSVEVRRNDASNLLMVSGSSDDVAAVEAMVRAADVAPRQISIEAKIVEVDRNKARDLGIDWSQIQTGVAFDQRYTRNGTHTEFQPDDAPPSISDQKRTDKLYSLSSNVQLYNALKLLDQNGAATFRDAPRILTLNNRRATILDGQRTTYITRYSSFTNLFATDSMDAGLRLSVLPSLGESGYLTLDVRAELTSISSNISGSPVKDGQIVENTVVVKDGETVVLGGFTRTTEERTIRRFPGLGYVLPFLFSREIVKQTSRESFVVITPHVVDLTASVDAKTQGVLDGK